MLSVEICVVLGALFALLVYGMVKTHLSGKWAVLPDVSKDSHR